MSKERKRASTLELDIRLDILQKLKAEGHRYTQLVKMAQQQWQVCERQAKEYLNKVTQREKSLAKQSEDETLGLAISKLRAIYSKALETGNLSLAAKLINQEIEIRQKYNLKRKESNAKHPVSGIAAISEGKELEALIQQLSSDGEVEMPSGL